LDILSEILYFKFKVNTFGFLLSFFVGDYVIRSVSLAMVSAEAGSKARPNEQSVDSSSDSRKRSYMMTESTALCESSICSALENFLLIYLNVSKNIV